MKTCAPVLTAFDEPLAIGAGADLLNGPSLRRYTEQTQQHARLHH